MKELDLYTKPEPSFIHSDSSTGLSAGHSYRVQRTFSQESVSTLVLWALLPTTDHRKLQELRDVPGLDLYKEC